MPSCPDGHGSTSTDFCDVCGLAMTGGISPAGAVPSMPAAPSPAAGGGAPAVSFTPDETCPDCGEPRTGRFCEGCSYDFVAGTSHGPTAPTAVIEQPTAVGPTAAPAAPAPGGWAVVVSADRAYFDSVQAEEGPDAADISFPAYCPERRFELSGAEIRIGRLSRSRGFAPEIDLTGPPADPGVSHLHAVLLAQPDGGWALVDPGSTNGTTVNDDTEPIRIGEALPVKPGDRIHVGAWTTITVHGPDDA